MKRATYTADPDRTQKIDDGLIIEMAKAITDLQMALVRRHLPPVTTISLHPITVREIIYQSRGNSPYLDYGLGIKRRPVIKLCGVELREELPVETSDAQSINPE